MQTPAPRTTPTPSSPPAPADAGDRTVRLTTPAIRRAAVAPPPRVPMAAPYRPQPYPPAPVAFPATTAALLDPSPGPRDSDGDDSDDADAPRFSLTATQVTASMSAAVVAAFIGAQLGVAGTIVGAAIASLVSVVGSAVIGHSLLLTRRKVTQTVHHVRVAAGSPADAVDTVLLTAVTRRDEIERTTPARPGPTGGATSARRGWWSRPGRLRWALVGLVASAAVFAAALGAVTIVEAVKGAPISGGENGFSVLGGNRGTAPQDAPSSSARTTVTETTTAPPTTTSSSAPATSSSATSSSPTPAATASTTASALPPATSAPATSAPTTAATTRASVAGTGTAAAPPAG